MTSSSSRSVPISSRREHGDPRKQQLTRRELEVLNLLVEDRRQKEVATRLVISQKTGATYIQNLLGKFGVHSRAELIARAYLLGHAGGLSTVASA
jgi:DNA-binding CsgD family transcriptional regulator